MTVRHILNEKGSDVVTLTPDVPISEAVAVLAKHRIGAIVVTNGAGVIKGNRCCNPKIASLNTRKNPGSER